MVIVLLTLYHLADCVCVLNTLYLFLIVSTGCAITLYLLIYATLYHATPAPSLHTVSRIKTETGTSIIIPPDTEKSDIIRIEGDPVGVKAAKNMLLEMATKMVRHSIVL